MSQIYASVSSTPSVPTSFVADDATTAVPAANILNVFSRDTTDDNDNGIQTTSDPNGGNNLYVELTNRQTSEVTTSDDTPTTLLTFSLGSSAGVYSVDGIIVANDLTDVAGACYYFYAATRTDGATGSEIGVEYGLEFEEAALMNADFEVAISGNNLVITVTGIAATTIDWLAKLEYRFLD